MHFNDEIKKKMNDMKNEENMNTPIQQFYKNSVIFMTGSTGFLGQVILEKLLRSCPQISRIYILVRNKKSKNFESRKEELFDDIFFEKMKMECPNYKQKVFVIEGDCLLPNLGISQSNITTLIDQVSRKYVRVIFKQF